MRGLIAALAVAAAAAFPAPAAAGAQKRLGSARDRWADRGLTDYHFRLELVCFCRGLEPFRLTVRDGRPVDPPDGARGATTVPRLFRIVQRAIDDDYDELEVTYGRSGLPRRVYVNPDADLADGSTTYLSSRLRGISRAA